MKFISPEVVLYLYKSTIQPWMEYCCHVWAGAPNCYLELLDKLKKGIYRTVSPSLTASLELLAHCQNVPSLSLFCRYYFERCSSKLAQLVPLPYSQGRSTCYSDKLHDFSVSISKCCKGVYVNSFFPHTARLWNSLPIEFFPLTYDLNGFKSRMNRHLLTVILSKHISCMLYFFRASFSCISMPCSGCWTLHGVNPNFKKVTWPFDHVFLQNYVTN